MRAARAAPLQRTLRMAPYSWNQARGQRSSSLPHLLNDALCRWLKEHPVAAVRATLPIVAGGNTVAVQVFGDQKTQHTIYWAPLPKALNFERRRFGAYTSDDNVRSGVQVVKVYPGESAETVTANGDGGSLRTSLRRGDVLLEINGQEITDRNTYFELVRLPPRTMQFTFRRDGRVYNAETVLDY